MIETVALIARRPDLPRAAFRDHYEKWHAPIALPHLSGLCGYTRNHLLLPEEGGADEPGFDVLSQFRYADRASLEATLANLRSEGGRAVRDDEQRFMDKPRNVNFPVEAVADGGAGGSEKVAVLARRPAGGEAQAFLARYEREALPTLRAGAARFRHEHVVARDDAPFDCLTWLWFEGRVPALAEPPMRDVGRWLALRVLEFSTTLEPAKPV